MQVELDSVALAKAEAKSVDIATEIINRRHGRSPGAPPDPDRTRHLVRWSLRGGQSRALPPRFAERCGRDHLEARRAEFARGCGADRAPMVGVMQTISKP